MVLTYFNEVTGQFEEITAIKGDDGATYTPRVDENGVLSWTNDKNRKNPEPQSIRGPVGESGVYYGSTQPDDLNVKVWIKEDESSDPENPTQTLSFRIHDSSGNPTKRFQYAKTLTGVHVTNAEVCPDSTIKFFMSDGTTMTTQNSLKGQDGVSPILSVGKISVLEAGEEPFARISPDIESPGVFKLYIGIPAGAKGADGVSDGGVGLKPGGKAGDVVVKLSDADYDWGFKTLSDASGKRWSHVAQTIEKDDVNLVELNADADLASMDEIFVRLYINKATYRTDGQAQSVDPSEDNHHLYMVFTDGSISYGLSSLELADFHGFDKSQGGFVYFKRADSGDNYIAVSSLCSRGECFVLSKDGTGATKNNTAMGLVPMMSGLMTSTKVRFFKKKNDETIPAGSIFEVWWR